MAEYKSMRIPREFKIRMQDVKINMSKEVGIPILKIPDTMVLRIVSNAHIWIPDKVMAKFFRRRKL